MEIGPRLGIAIGAYDLLGRGWHCGVIYGSLASAAALARLARLDVERTEEALGMAATQASGLMSAQFEGDVKRLQHGFADDHDGRVAIERSYLPRAGVFLEAEDFVGRNGHAMAVIPEDMVRRGRRYSMNRMSASPTG